MKIEYQLLMIAVGRKSLKGYLRLALFILVSSTWQVMHKKKHYYCYFFCCKNTHKNVCLSLSTQKRNQQSTAIMVMYCKKTLGKTITNDYPMKVIRVII